MESGTQDKDRSRLAERVLEHPIRARLEAEPRGRRASAAALAEALGEPLAPVTYHCRVLARAGAFELHGGAGS